MSAPFWAGRKDSAGDNVLLSDYAVDPDRGSHRFPGAAADSLASRSAARRRPRFPSGAPADDRGKDRERNTLPAAEVRPNARVERKFNNSHIKDKRLGASSRAEMLRRQILRGSQDDTVVRGAPAFKDRNSDGYNELDKLQPEGGGGQPKRRAMPDSESSSSDSESSGGAKRATEVSHSKAIEDVGLQQRLDDPVRFVPASTTAPVSADISMRRRLPGLASGTSSGLRRVRPGEEESEEERRPEKRKALLDEINELAGESTSKRRRSGRSKGAKDEAGPACGPSLAAAAPGDSADQTYGPALPAAGLPRRSTGQAYQCPQSSQ